MSDFVLEFEEKNYFHYEIAFAMRLYPKIFLITPTTLTLDYSLPIRQRQEESKVSLSTGTEQKSQ